MNGRHPHQRVGLWAALLASGLVATAGAWQGGLRWPARVSDRSDYPQWQIPQPFAHDTFTFVRIQFDSPRSLVDSCWDNDYPDADWNFSYRLQQLTSLRVDPDGRVLRLDDPRLRDYPFIFMLGIRDIQLTEGEVLGLRNYLLGGGFLMVDDFWSPRELEDITAVFARVLPGHQPRELTLEHPLFHIVYDLKTLPQVPSIHAWRRGRLFEYWHGDPAGDERPHYYGYFDDQQRLVALLCMNNDLCDGWEREGENVDYFHQFSEKQAYPLGINIVTYALTH